MQNWFTQNEIHGTYVLHKKGRVHWMYSVVRYKDNWLVNAPLLLKFKKRCEHVHVSITRQCYTFVFNADSAMLICYHTKHFPALPPSLPPSLPSLTPFANEHLNVFPLVFARGRANKYCHFFSIQNRQKKNQKRCCLCRLAPHQSARNG